MGINLTKKTDLFKKKIIVCVCVCVYICIYVYIYIYMYIYICTHIFRLNHGKENSPQNKLKHKKWGIIKGLLYAQLGS